MKKVMVLTGAIGSGLVTLAAGAAEMTELPAGQNRDLVATVCQGCHDLKMVFDGAGFSRNEWDGALDEMAANGMNIPADEREKILVYLSTYLGPSPPPATGAR